MRAGVVVEYALGCLQYKCLRCHFCEPHESSPRRVEIETGFVKSRKGIVVNSTSIWSMCFNENWETMVNGPILTKFVALSSDHSTGPRCGVIRQLISYKR